MAEASLAGLADEHRARLEAYEALLAEDAPRLGLLSPHDLSRIWPRHILDSLRVLECLRASDRSLIDLGSGGGLPGIPAAIARPQLEVLLVEPRSRRAAFLEKAIEALGLENASVVVARAGSLHARADVVTARALASLEETWRLAEPLLTGSGRALYFAGHSWTSADGEGVSAAGGMVSICAPPKLEWEGPIVMISRSSVPDRERKR